MNRASHPADQPPSEPSSSDPKRKRGNDNAVQKDQAQNSGVVDRVVRVFDTISQDQAVPHQCTEQKGPRKPPDDVSRSTSSPGGNQVYLSDTNTDQHRQDPFGIGLERHRRDDYQPPRRHKVCRRLLAIFACLSLGASSEMRRRVAVMSNDRTIIEDGIIFRLPFELTWLCPFRPIYYR